MFEVTLTAEFTAEVTVATHTGEAVTVTASGGTPELAVELVFAEAKRIAAPRRRTGFYLGGFEFRTGTTPAPFGFGFAG